MSNIIVLIVLLLWVNSTVQRAKIGQLCPEADKLKNLFGDQCIEITCKFRKISKSNFTISTDNGLYGLHPKYHRVEKCDWGCASGYLAIPVNPKVMNLMYPRCCENHICINSLKSLRSLAIDN
ncbi:hypothetical protein PV325_007042 [Microctonus aethiopoides]|nr:hypothetical protein PV325_007042 [Microctonus aethiopoides]